jgi:hypothetical protein
MADFGAPVAQNVNVNPQQGIQTLSGLLGLKQQQIGIQQQQQQLQTQTAEAQQAQQKNQELQQLAAFTKAAVNDPNYRLPDGSPDVTKFSADAMMAAPTYGQAYLGNTISNFKEGVASRQALQNLNNDQRTQLANALMPATKPGTTPSELLDVVAKARALNTDPGYQRMIDNSVLGADRGNPADAAARAVSMLTGKPLVAPQQVDVGGQVLTGTTPTMGSGTGTFTPSGQAIQKTLAPTQTVPYQQAVAGATAAASGGAAVDVQRFNGITNAAATAQTGVALADQVAELAQQVRTGELSQDWANKLTVLKQSDPSITARQMLAKYAAQLKTTATSGAATDAERAQIDQGMPSPETMNPQAVQQAAQYLHGYFRMSQARGINALQHVGATGTPAGLTQSDTAFMQSKDPFVYAFKDMNRAQQVQFLIDRYGRGGSKDPQGFATFEQRVKGAQ